MSGFVIMPVSFPACENMMCRRFYHTKKQGRSVKPMQSGSRGEKKRLTSLRNMFTTSSNGTSFRNCMASSNSGDRSAESPSCGPRNAPMRVAPPLSERRGTANRVTQPIKDFKAGKDKTRTNKTPELFPCHVSQKRPVLYNRKPVVLPSFR